MTGLTYESPLQKLFIRLHHNFSFLIDWFIKKNKKQQGSYND